MSSPSGETWSSPQGLETLRNMLRSLIPQWNNGPYEYQLNSTAAILDRRKQIVVAACGEGKTALSYMHLLVMQELIRNPSLPRFGLHIPEGLKPTVLMVTPLSDLGRSQVAEMTNLGIKAVALDAKRVKTAQRPLLKERMKTPEFDSIVRDDTFRKHLVLYVVDECHVVIPWSQSFRKCYGDIGDVCSRIPPDVPTVIYCQSIELGDRVAEYLYRLRPPGADRMKNIRTYNALHSDEDNAKTLREFENDPEAFVVIATIKFGMGIDVRCAQVVINLGLPESAEATLQQIGRAGRNPLVDALGITYLEMKLVADALTAAGKGKRRAKSSATKKPKKAQAKPKQKNVATSSKAADADDLEGRFVNLEEGLRRLVSCHALEGCLVAEFNQLFGSPGLASHANCLDAQRRLPCSSCSDHEPFVSMPRNPHPSASLSTGNTASMHPATSPSTSVPAAIVTRAASSAQAKDTSMPPAKYAKLTKAMRDHAEKKVDAFMRTRWLRKDISHSDFLPYVCYMPSTMQARLFNDFHMIRSRDDLATLLVGWTHLSDDCDTLYSLVQELNTRYDQAHDKMKAERASKAAATRARNKATKQGAPDLF
ncbi:P-loop containing nucleoside triphosphate hydrolase protein [Artomyces pyxidatus]|uniref:P-loop containing nucleoside triphosphate hydrolase protein n=1 Tax=Artomyces pyxidatus TaxID=48021 RepID=A0ACB8SEW3_9AGAM|nr:P-loop containing nucleoside triphosphate hydrolase protein [Artomyces pyxidatus]